MGVRDTPNRSASSRSSRRRFPGIRPLTMSCSMAAMIFDCVEGAFSGTRRERLGVRAADEAFIEGTELTREDEGTLVRLCAPAGQPDRRLGTPSIVAISIRNCVYCMQYL